MAIYFDGLSLMLVSVECMYFSMWYIETRRTARNGSEKRAPSLLEEYNGKIKKRDVSSAKAGKKSATGRKIWSDGRKRGRNVNITARRVPGICITYNLH